MTMINAFSGASNDLSEADRDLIDRRARALGPAYRLFYETPVHLVRGEGVWLYDPEGNAYLDTYNNVACLGHGRPEVIEAMARQAAVLNTHTRYLNESIVDYAEALLAEFPPELSNLMMTCTGSEANDLALRIAEAHTGGTGVIITDTAYHGTSKLTAGLSPSLGAANPIPANVRRIAPPADATADGGAAFGARVAAAAEELRAAGTPPCALLVDTIFSTDGVFADPAGFLAPAVAAIHEAGGLFIADEVQPGFGRTGDAMWGFARHGVVPDLVTMGKPMGNGYPVAGLVVRPGIVERFGTERRYFNTFGGNPVACAVAGTVLRILREEDMLAHVARTGAYLRDGLQALGARFPLIHEVRGAGLFIGLELRRDGAAATAETAQVVNGLRRRRVLISATGPEANALKIRPPLVFGREHADIFLGALEETLAELPG